MDFYKINQLLENERWTFAKTMPSIPHQWVSTRTWSNTVPFVEVVQYIRDHGRRERWGKYNHHYLYLSGWKYWTMGAPAEETTIINRARPDYASPYDGIASKYDKVFSDKQFLKETKALFNLIQPKGRILDVGCGTGLLVEWNQNIDPERYCGIDPSKNMLELFSWKHPSFASSLRCSTFEDCWLKGFDTIVFLFGAASYIKNAARAKEMLNKGGTAYLMYFKEDYHPVTHKRFNIYEGVNSFALPETNDQFVFTNYLVERLNG